MYVYVYVYVYIYIYIYIYIYRAGGQAGLRRSPTPPNGRRESLQRFREEAVANILTS